MIMFNYIVMCLIFGTTFLAIKVGVDAGAPPFFSAGIRFFFWQAEFCSCGLYGGEKQGFRCFSGKK